MDRPRFLHRLARDAIGRPRFQRGLGPSSFPAWTPYRRREARLARAQGAGGPGTSPGRVAGTATGRVWRVVALVLLAQGPSNGAGRTSSRGAAGAGPATWAAPLSLCVWALRGGAARIEDFDGDCCRLDSLLPGLSATGSLKLRGAADSWPERV